MDRRLDELLDVDHLDDDDVPVLDKVLVPVPTSTVRRWTRARRTARARDALDAVAVEPRVVAEVPVQPRPARHPPATPTSPASAPGPARAQGAPKAQVPEPEEEVAGPEREAREAWAEEPAERKPRERPPRPPASEPLQEPPAAPAQEHVLVVPALEPRRGDHEVLQAGELLEPRRKERVRPEERGRRREPGRQTQEAWKGAPPTFWFSHSVGPEPRAGGRVLKRAHFSYKK